MLDHLPFSWQHMDTFPLFHPKSPFFPWHHPFGCVTQLYMELKVRSINRSRLRTILQRKTWTDIVSSPKQLLVNWKKTELQKSCWEQTEHEKLCKPVLLTRKGCTSHVVRSEPRQCLDTEGRFRLERRFIFKIVIISILILKTNNSKDVVDSLCFESLLKVGCL